MDDVIWLATEAGAALHLLDVSGPRVTAGYRGLARWRTGRRTTVVTGHVPTHAPTVPLSRPRTRLDRLDADADEWAPIVDAFTALDLLAGGEAQQLEAWHDAWLTTYENPNRFGPSGLAGQLDQDARPLAWQLAIAGTSGITRGCRRCQGDTNGLP